MNIPGVLYSIRYFPVGPLCLSKHNGRDRRLDDNFPSFKKFNRTLVQVCEPGKASFDLKFLNFSNERCSQTKVWKRSRFRRRVKKNDDCKSDFLIFAYLSFAGEGDTLVISPNSSWPDLVYYQSFTHANMGWKIHVVDSYTKNGAIIHKLSLLIAITTVFRCLL